MKRVQNSKYRVKKTLIYMICVTLYILNSAFLIPSISAQEATGSVKAASTSSTLQQKIQALKDEVASKAASLKLEVNKQLANKLAAGQILDQTDTKIVVNTLDLNPRGSTKSQNILINEYTDYLDNLKPKSKVIEVDDLAIGDFIVGLGDMDDQGTLTAKKVLLITKPEFNKTITWGTISEIKPGSLSIKNKDHQTDTFIINKNTKIQRGTEEATTEDLAINKTVTISSVTEENKANATYIYIIPQGLELSQDKKLEATKSSPATNSAQKR